MMCRIGVLVVVLAAGCTSKNPDYCSADTECDDPAKPFCDVAGEFVESGHTPHICTARPAGCSIERCGCTPGEGLSCDLDQRTVCAADGHSTSMETCALGCSTEPRCLTFEPSNGLGPALEMAAKEPDVVLPAGVRIDTDLGTITMSTGAPLPVASTMVSQQNGPSIRVFLGNTFVVENATVTGSAALAIVAPGGVAVKGVVDASASAVSHGPGGQDSPAVCVGSPGQQSAAGSFTNAYGGGGGGASTTGGHGGGFSAPGGAAGALIPTFSPLTGGCRGGGLSRVDGTKDVGGGGGGAIQLVSSTHVQFSGTGLLHVSGGGGPPTTGGGSGGTVVIEAPDVVFTGATTGIAANGGAGGGCAMAGADGGPTAVAAAGPKCSPSSAGNGGTGALAPEPGQQLCSGSGSCGVLSQYQGGGGGAAGRVLVRTRSGSVETSGGPLFSAALSVEPLTAQ